jgi:hypothetical protein
MVYQVVVLVGLSDSHRFGENLVEYYLQTTKSYMNLYVKNAEPSTILMFPMVCMLKNVVFAGRMLGVRDYMINRYRFSPPPFTLSNKYSMINYSL